jgi:hypothetical protein
MMFGSGESEARRAEVEQQVMAGAEPFRLEGNYKMSCSEFPFSKELALSYW